MQNFDVLKNFVDSESRLIQYPKKKAVRMYALAYIASRFETGTRYDETQVNGIINAWHTYNDHTALRRALTDYKFLNRKRDGSEYWLADPQPDIDSLISDVL